MPIRGEIPRSANKGRRPPYSLQTFINKRTACLSRSTIHRASEKALISYERCFHPADQSNARSALCRIRRLFITQVTQVTQVTRVRPIDVKARLNVDVRYATRIPDRVSARARARAQTHVFTCDKGSPSNECRKKEPGVQRRMKGFPLYRFYPCFKLLPAHCGRRAWARGQRIGERKRVKGVASELFVSTLA